jgi:hypothetical protein
MTLLERIVTSEHRTTDLGRVLGPWSLRLRGAAAGAFAVGATLVALCLPVLLAWVASPDNTVGWGSALGVAASAWLLGLGVDLHAAGTTVSLTPLLITAVEVAGAVLCARHALSRLPAGDGTDRLSTGRLRRAVCDCAAGFVGSYALLGLLVSLATRPAGVRVSSVAAFLFAAGWAALGFGYAAGRAQGPGLFPAGPTSRWGTVAAYVRRAVGPAGWGIAALLAIGALIVLGSVLANFRTVSALSSSLGGGPAGQLVLGIVQLTVLPDLALWALSWMAGPGFSLAQGLSVTWSGAHPGTLPVIPVLGALPAPGPFPRWVAAAALAPACAGVFLAWRAGRSMSALTSWRFRAQVTASACVLCSAALTLLAWMSTGSLGAGGLASAGPPAVLTGAALLGEIALGAAVGCLAVGWRARRGLGASGSA